MCQLSDGLHRGPTHFQCRICPARQVTANMRLRFGRLARRLAPAEGFRLEFHKRDMLRAEWCDDTDDSPRRGDSSGT
jgi:hypothetical protein